jgi:hypothetical protein
MRFSKWYPASEIDNASPHEAGVFQVRGAQLIEYPRGKSAMVFYGSGANLRADIGSWARERNQEGYLYRHSLELGSSSPTTLLERLSLRFRDRFGADPGHP